MSEILNPKSLYSEVLAERKSKAALAAAELVSKNNEREKYEAVMALKLTLQAELIAGIINAGPGIAELLKVENRKFDANTVRPVQKHYRREKTPRPLFGRKFEEGYYTGYLPDKPVWFITTRNSTNTYTRDDAVGNSYCNVPDWTDYKTYHHLTGRGLCLDEQGLIHRYDWSIDTGKGESQSKNELLVVTLLKPENDNFVSVNAINKEASNSDEISQQWRDIFKKVLLNQPTDSSTSTY